jgi:hypothetical protein
MDAQSVTADLPKALIRWITWSTLLSTVMSSSIVKRMLLHPIVWLLGLPSMLSDEQQNSINIRLSLKSCFSVGADGTIYSPPMAGEVSWIFDPEIDEVIF